MKPLTSEWVTKAEADFTSACREYRARKNPNFDAACFFAQQCIEKYLKARLQEADIRFGKVHDLPYLLDLALSIEPAWQPLREAMEDLTDFAVDLRYPGFSASKDMAKKAVAECKRMRVIFRNAL